MKSIAELSNQLSVSKTSIYNILKKNETALKEHTHKKQGKTFLDEYAEKFLIDYYATEALETLQDIDTEESEINANSTSFNEFKANSTSFNEFKANSTSFNEFKENPSVVETDSNTLNVIAILQKQLEIKDEQLERKDVQIKDLTESIKTISLAFSDRDRAKQHELYLQAIGKKEIIESTSPPTDEIIEPPPKENFFTRLFRKK